MPAPGPTERQKGREDEQLLPRKAKSGERGRDTGIVK